MLCYSSCIARRANGLLLQDVVAVTKTLVKVHTAILKWSVTEGVGNKKLISKPQAVNFQFIIPHRYDNNNNNNNNKY